LKSREAFFPELKYLNLGNSFSRRNGVNITEDRFREGKREQGNVKFRQIPGRKMQLHLKSFQEVSSLTVLWILASRFLACACLINCLSKSKTFSTEDFLEALLVTSIIICMCACLSSQVYVYG